MQRIVNKVAVWRVMGSWFYFLGDELLAESLRSEFLSLRFFYNFASMLSLVIRSISICNCVSGSVEVKFSFLCYRPFTDSTINCYASERSIPSCNPSISAKPLRRPTKG